MTELGDKVAEHYNNIEEKGLEERTKSRIFYLRNFNNWIKSQLIGETLDKVKQRGGRSNRSSITVLDIGCGKGGDLLKWKKGEISYLVCADIAGTSIEQCERRFQDTNRRMHYERHRRPAKLEAEFITADCTKVRLKDLYQRKNIQFDLVSCQFAFHYCFESIQQVDRMLQNASECLRPGGYFIGTTPDAYEIMKRLRKTEDGGGGQSYGNDVYRITFDDVSDGEVRKLFGTKYNFHLTEVVDCPEFVVNFPVLTEMAKRHGLELVLKKRFDEYFWERLKHEDYNTQQDARQLLGRMQALESYPPFHDTELSSKSDDDYEHAAEFLKKRSSEEEGSGDGRQPKLGTLSRSEWEAITVYVVFAFKKVEAAEERKPSKRKLEDDGGGDCAPKKVAATATPETVAATATPEIVAATTTPEPVTATPATTASEETPATPVSEEDPETVAATAAIETPTPASPSTPEDSVDPD